MDPTVDGVFSILDTDLYKLTMQSAVLKYFPRVKVAYAFTNRTPHMRLTQEAFEWLRFQIDSLKNIYVTPEEIEYLKTHCPYFAPAYLTYLSNFRLDPASQVSVSFSQLDGSDLGDLSISIHGLWVETILYEIPLLALTSEAYFKFCDRDWNHDGQREKAYAKGQALLQAGCMFSEFGSRRRRDYRTHNLVIQGLCAAAGKGEQKGWKGKMTGTSNVHFAMKYDIPAIGTVAHEWSMGIAALTDNYEGANEMALKCWLGCYGEGVLGIALTDTFGTADFFRAFSKPIPATTSASQGAIATLPSSTPTQATESLAETKAPLSAPLKRADKEITSSKSYAQVFTGIRQDSGDPIQYVKIARDFYDSVGITEKKVIVFSDSLNVDRCIEYKQVAEHYNFAPSFGVGTFLTNDFVHVSNQRKSVPLNIVIKLSHAGGRPAIKISDNIGKNTGDSGKVSEVKSRLGYEEHAWKEGDETGRWGREGEK